MKGLDKRKNIAAKVLNVGKNRLYFDPESLSEIKEAITKQDIRELHSQGIIKVKEKKGRKKVEKRKTKRGPGKIKKKVNNRKQEYVKRVRKQREYIKNLLKLNKIEKETYRDLRKQIKANSFKSLNNLRAYLRENK